MFCLFEASLLSLVARGSAVRKIQQKRSCFVYLRPHFDFKLEDSNLFVKHSSSWWCISTPGLATKGSNILKISSRQTLTNILNLCCDLHLEHSKPIFSPHIPALMMLQKNNELRIEILINSEYITEIVIPQLSELDSDSNWFYFIFNLFLTLQVMMMHHCTKFDFKRLSKLENIHWARQNLGTTYFQYNQPLPPPPPPPPNPSTLLQVEYKRKATTTYDIWTAILHYVTV